MSKKSHPQMIIDHCIDHPNSKVTPRNRDFSSFQAILTFQSFCHVSATFFFIISGDQKASILSLLMSVSLNYTLCLSTTRYHAVSLMNETQSNTDSYTSTPLPFYSPLLYQCPMADSCDPACTLLSIGPGSNTEPMPINLIPNSVNNIEAGMVAVLERQPCYEYDGRKGVRLSNWDAIKQEAYWAAYSHRINYVTHSSC